MILRPGPGSMVGHPEIGTLAPLLILWDILFESLPLAISLSARPDQTSQCVKVAVATPMSGQIPHRSRHGPLPPIPRYEEHGDPYQGLKERRSSPKKHHHHDACHQSRLQKHRHEMTENTSLERPERSRREERSTSHDGLRRKKRSRSRRAHDAKSHCRCQQELEDVHYQPVKPLLQPKVEEINGNHPEMIPVEYQKNYLDPEMGDTNGVKTNVFAEKSVRRGFIRGFYGILFVQLLLTTGIIALYVFVDAFKALAVNGNSIYWVAFALLMICMFALFCCDKIRRKSPMNFLFLTLFTICEGVLMGTFAAHFETDSVLIAAGISVAVTFALTLFAFQTKYDLTICSGMLWGSTVVLVGAAVLMALLPMKKWLTIVYGSIGALVFSLYLVCDTQLMIGGEYKYAIDPEEYITAVLNLYLDIINLFMHFLSVVGHKCSSK